MNRPRVKIVYLFHSGYAVEIGERLFIFDYFQPEPMPEGNLTDGVITTEYLKTKSKIYVLVSHNHPDHYDSMILEWAKSIPDITYIISSDVQIDGKHCKIMNPYEEWQQDGVGVKTFGSTDEGLSFLVEVDGLKIFHAGDLNWWHWKGDTKANQERAEAMFKAEVDKIASQAIDIVFFPVDQRLEEFYCIGAEYFAAKLHPALLVPMHFGDVLGTTKAFAEKMKNTSLVTVEITHRGQTIFF
ncbi:MAG: hypothetical protein H6Q74_638 [Firmicutes bacterium]|nr:hypothetical protein [Bacillota bacterium]